MPVAEPVSRFDPNRQRRRSVRLRYHDYAGGLYFVTICTHGRLPLFGEIADGEMTLSVAGEIVTDEWMRTGEIRAEVVLDAFVVMPNHVHGIVGIIDRNGPDRRGTMHRAPTRRFSEPVAHSLSTIVGTFKAAVTRRINHENGRPGAAVWQRNYWERVLRDDRELAIARRYIADNPLRWHLDRLHPGRPA